MHTTLVLTHECNLACTYCYMGEHYQRSMSDETCARSLDLAFEGTERVDLGFFGGEPMIEFERMERVCVAAIARAQREGRALRMQVTTNGTLVTAARAARLAELGVEVTISIDGVREAHDATRPQRGGQSSFDAALRGARNVVAAGLPLEVIAVVAPANARHLGATVRFLAELGARQIVLNPCFELPWTDAQLEEWERGMRDAAEVYAEQMRAGRPIPMPTFDNKLLAAVKGGLAGCDTCSAGVREIAVAPSGNLYPCARMVKEDRDHALVVGHLDSGIDRRRVKRFDSGFGDPACDTCAEKWRCGASCSCANLAETGDPAVPGGTQCWYEQASARVADAIGAKLLDERDPTFLAWTYGRVAQAAEQQARAEAATQKSSVRRVRRLPVLQGVA